MSIRNVPLRALGLLLSGALIWFPACGGKGAPAASGGAGGATTGTGGVAGSPGTGGAGGSIAAQPVVISTAARKPRVTTLGVNYWMWSPTYGDELPGTETAIAAVAPAIMRVGGYNNDANTPDPFDDAQLDAAVTYARAIGAEPLIQIPRLADVNGQPPTADTAAAMVRYANVTKGYGIKYFSIGNEPDLYDTQGAVADSSQPAIPGYSPADYCTSARAYVAAMKAVDPTIQIVGPDLAYKYQTNSANDWLTPILTNCGELLDVVSIHRYPFSHAQASAAAAQADRAAFAGTLTAVRALMTAAGQGEKPLALTEMNVAYDATTCVLDASPGTVGAGLWMADSLGEAIQHDLWTTAVWDISDPAPYALGLLDQAPGHVARPAYYAYALYAAHFGPTVLNVPSTPAGVSAHASRNAADTATEVIVANWNTTMASLAFQVNGLAVAPAPATFVLPALSMAAIELPDTGAETAWVYGEAQRRASGGPEPLAPGVVPPPVTGAATGGAGLIPGTNCGSSAAVCPQVTLPSPAITTMGKTTANGLQFGSGAAAWGSYTYAGTGQAAPVGVPTADGNGIQITGGFKAPVDPSGNYMGVGLYFNSTSCVNAAGYSGVKFDFTGDLGGCGLALGMSFSGDLVQADNPGRGACASTNCYGPSAAITPATGTTVAVPFASLTGGMPVASLDPTTVVTVQWQLTSAPAGDGSCSANFTVANVAFY